MVVTIKLADGTLVTGELVKESKVTSKDLSYKLSANCPSVWKGGQRQIVYDILKSEDRFWTLSEVAAIATVKGLQASGGVTDSCGYHLHNMAKLGVLETK